MTKNARQLEGLRMVTAARLASAQAAFQKYRSQELALRETLAQLKQDCSERAQQAGKPDAALAAGADVLWLQWVARRRAAINSELAQVLSRKIECQQKLNTAFGKDQVVKSLVAQRKG